MKSNPTKKKVGNKGQKKKGQAKLLNSGVKKIVLSNASTPDFLKGKKNEPPLVQITSKEDGGFLIARIPKDGFLLDTTPLQKSETKWIFKMVPPGGPHFTPKDICPVKGEGIQVMIFRKDCGSGKFWLEAFVNKPENKAPTGFFISGYCPAKITKVTWHKYQKDNKGPEIKKGEDVKYGDMLQLHIETEGLNGDVLKVSFLEDQKDSILETVKGATFGGKLIINFPIKTIWRTEYFNSAERFLSFDLNITVQINHERLQTGFKGSVLKIKNKLSERKLEKGSAVPVNIGKVEIDVKKYELCKYASLKIKSSDREYTIFDNGKLKELVFDIVAGSKKGNEVTISLTDINTKQCSESNSHKNRVLSIDIPEVKYVAPEETFQDLESIEEANFVEEKTKRWDFTLVEGKAEHSRKSMGTTNKSINKIEDKEVDFASVKRSDKQLSFNARYNYGNIKDNFKLNAFRYFWLSKTLAQEYKVTAETCAYKHVIPIRVFPDIKWILQFKLNCEGMEFDKVKRPDAKVGFSSFENDGKSTKPSSSKSPKKEGNFQGLMEVLKQIDISLSAEWDNGNEILELSKEFAESTFNSLKEINKIFETIVKIIEGKHSGSASISSQDEKSLEEFIAKLNRKPQELKPIYPSISFSGAWFCEEVKNKGNSQINRQALAVELKFAAEPFIGFEMKWDLLELLCRRHPISYAILKIVDGLLYLLSDKESEIILNFTVKGEIKLNGQLKHNLISGNSFGNGYSPEKEESASTGGVLTVSLEAKINLSKTVYIFQYNVVTSFGVGASAEAALGLKTYIGADLKGIYLSNQIFFEGLKLSYNAKGKIELNSKDKLERPVKQSQSSPDEKKTLAGREAEIKGEIIFAKFQGDFTKLYIKKHA